MSLEPGSALTRPTPMRRLLGTLITTVVVGVTAGCGSSSSSVATDPASDPAGPASRTPGPVTDAHVLPLISMTGGGGRPTTTAQPLDTSAQARRFVSQFHVPAMQHRVRDAITGASSSGELVGQVVAVGCDRPPGVDVMVDADGQVELVPREVASPLEECLAPVTTVAIAVLPSH